jgi:acetyltransferase-like isoleucine patch superfamily enzyme
MLLIIVVVLILISIAIAICFSIIGRKLDLFSYEKLKETAIFRFVGFRWLLFAIIGFEWLLAKVHFPGTELLVTYGFDNKLGHVLRAAYWKCRVRKLGKDVIIDIGAKVVGWQGVSIGDNSWIDRNVILETGKIDQSKFLVYVKKTTPLVKEGELLVGKGCHIAKNVVIQAHGGVFIGDFSGIASGSKIYSLSHHYKNMKNDDGIIYKFTPLAPSIDQSIIQGSVVFDGNNALGLNSVVLPGVTIGKNTWIGTCSCVVEDIPPNCVATGCPAKVIKWLNKT